MFRNHTEIFALYLILNFQKYLLEIYKSTSGKKRGSSVENYSVLASRNFGNCCTAVISHRKIFLRCVMREKSLYGARSRRNLFPVRADDKKTLRWSPQTRSFFTGCVTDAICKTFPSLRIPIP